MEIKQIIFMLRRWYWLLAVGLAVGVVGGIVVTLVMTPVYQLESTILVSRSTSAESTEFPNLNNLQLAQTYAELLTTQRLREQVSEQVGSKLDPEKLTVEQVRDSQIIQITYEDTDPVRGAQILNGLVKALQIENTNIQTQQYQTEEASLQAQIDEAKAQMEALQTEITQFLSQDVQSQLDEVDAQIASLETEITDVQQQIALMGNPLALVIQGRLEDSQARLTMLQDQLTQYQGIRTNLLFLGRPNANTSGVTSPHLDQLYSTLDQYQNIYLSHLNSLEALRLAKLQSTPTVRQLQVATIPDNPARPIPVIYVGLAGVIGVLLGGAIMLAYEFFDDSIKTPEDVKPITSVPVLGMVRKATAINMHFINNKEINQPPLSSVFEDYRSLGVQLQYQREMKKFTTLMITSPGHGEGKTTAAINLATIFARSGQQVILLDANLQQPRLHTILGDESEIQVLDLAPIGRERDLARSDMLGMTKIVRVLDRIQDWGNRLVIIDAPPIFTADAKILASKVDGVMLVLKAWESTKASLRTSLEDLRQVDANVIGVMLNDIPTEYSYYYNSYSCMQTAPNEKEAKNPITRFLQKRGTRTSTTLHAQPPHANEKV